MDKQYKSLMLRVQKIIERKEHVLLKEKVQKHFDVGLYRFVWFVVVIVFLFGGNWYVTSEKVNDPDRHFNMEENITLHKVPEIEEDVEHLGNVVLSNERGLLVVETKLIAIEATLEKQDKKLDKILEKLE